MRKLLITICLLLVCSNGWAAKNYCFDDDAVGCWLFTEGSGESVADSSPNSNTGTFKGAGEPAWDTTDVPFSYAGVAPNSVDFDGNDDYINAGAGASLANLGPVSFTAWINLNSYTNQDRIFIKGVDADPWDVLYLFELSGTEGALLFYVVFDTDDGWRTTSTTLSAGWNHVAVTWDGSGTATNIHIYINGVEASYSAANNISGSYLDDSAYPLIIGNNNGGTNAIDGLMTDVGLFSRVLTATEITEIMNYGLTGRRLIF